MLDVGDVQCAGCGRCAVCWMWEMWDMLSTLDMVAIGLKVDVRTYFLGLVLANGTV